MAMTLSTLSDLSKLRHATDLNEVNLVFDDSKFRGNLALYPIKYGVWALRRGGHLKIHAPGLPTKTYLTEKRLSFHFLVQLIARVSEGWASICHYDLDKRKLVLKRTRPVLSPGWSAGVVFSGASSEAESLNECIKGLLEQPELLESRDIVVCGPSASRNMLATNKYVRYLPYDTPFESGRFLLGRKKNILLKALHHERALICHTRIVLRPKCLSLLPREFDIITPRVWTQGSKSCLPYLDLQFVKTATEAMIASGVPVPCYYDRHHWHDYLSTLYPFIDGGLFCVRRQLAIQTPIHDTIAWGEAEDVEWCKRLLQSGNLVELAEYSHADSSICKMPIYHKWGHMKTYRLIWPAWKYCDAIFSR